MVIFIQLVILFFVLLVLNEIFRRSKVFSYITFTVLLVAISFTWIGKPHMDWFRWVKVYSASTGVLIFTSIRHTKLKYNRIAYWFVYGILAVNIAEAVIKDLLIFKPSSILNAIAGILIIVTMKSVKKIKVDENKEKDLLWNLGWGWIIAYTAWNILVVMGNDAVIASRHVVLLLVPIIVNYFKPGTWLQARANTLAILFIYVLTFPNFVAKFSTPSWDNEIVKLVMGIISITIAIGYTFKRFVLDKKNNSKVETVKS